MNDEVTRFMRAFMPMFTVAVIVLSVLAVWSIVDRANAAYKNPVTCDNTLSIPVQIAAPGYKWVIDSHDPNCTIWVQAPKSN